MASGSKVAVANCSTYIQGCLSWDANATSSGIVVNVRMYMRRTNDYSGSTNSSSVTQSICISGDPNNYGYSQTGALTVAGGQQNTWQGPYFTASRTFDSSRSGNTIYVGWKTVDNLGYGYLSGSGNVQITLPQAYTAPSTPSATVKEIYTNGAKFGVSVSSYGNPASASGRYIEACISSTNDYFGTRKYGTSGNVSSADITVTNTSGAGGNLNIQPNSRYYYGAYANNTQLSTYTMIGQLVTLPPALSAKSATVTGTNSIRVNYTTAADGGWRAKNIQYNIGNGWVTGATVSAAASTSGNFTISGLSTGTSYTINLRVNTSAGSTGSGSVSATTYKIPANATVSATNSSSTSNAVTYGVTTFNTGPNPGVYLYGGTSASPTTQLTSKTTTGDSTYSHTGLTGNTKYYYRSRAKNDGGWSAYSSDATAITRPANPTITINSLGHHTVSLSISSPSQGSAATMTAYYKVDGGSATSAGTISSGGSKAVQLSFDPQTSHTVTAYLSNSSGDSGEATSTFATKIPFYAPVSGQSKMIKKLYCSVNGEAKKVQHLYASVNGQAKKIF